MRAAPAFQVVLTRFGLWRFAVSCLAAMAAACIVACVATQAEAPSGARWAAAAGGVALTALVGTSLRRVDAVSLRWDGRCWHLGPPASAGEEPCSGSIAVAVDLGGFLLLRFVPDAAARRPAATWLPVQRRGLEGPWHALRCAVYSPRPSPGPDALADH